MFTFTSWMAITSNLEIISVIHLSAFKLRFGLSLWITVHFSVKSPKARMLQVAIGRFSSGDFWNFVIKFLSKFN